jgi:hypothetical protein
MLNNEERLSRERLAASVDWALNPPQPGTSLAENVFLAPEAAVTVLNVMVARYEWLSIWVEKAEKAALAATAVEVAETTGAPQAIITSLKQTADEALMEQMKSSPPQDIKAEQILKTFAALQRAVAERPEGYS